MTEIRNGEENLIRQIAKYHVDAGRVNHKVFKPKTADLNKLSVSMESGISPEEAFRHFTQAMNASSCGYATLKVHQVNAQELEAHIDPIDPAENLFNINHAVIDYTPCPDHNKTAKVFLKTVQDLGTIKIIEEPTPQPPIVATAPIAPNANI